MLETKRVQFFDSQCITLWRVNLCCFHHLPLLTLMQSFNFSSLFLWHVKKYLLCMTEYFRYTPSSVSLTFLLFFFTCILVMFIHMMMTMMMTGRETSAMRRYHHDTEHGYASTLPPATTRRTSARISSATSSSSSSPPPLTTTSRRHRRNSKRSTSYYMHSPGVRWVSWSTSLAHFIA